MDTLTWNDLLDIELRNRGNADVERILAHLRATEPPDCDACEEYARGFADAKECCCHG